MPEGSLMLTTLLDLVGVICFAFFAFSLYPPACLLVVGVAALLISRSRS